MLEGILKGLFQWIYGLFLELISYCANALLKVMSTDLNFWETSVPVVTSLYRVLTAIGWGLLIGNCVFQALKAMFAGLGFETESPAILLLRTGLFGTLLIFSKDICDIGLSIGKNVMNLIGIPTSVTITTPTEAMFSASGVGWLLVIIIGFILGFQLFKLFFEIAERYVVVAVLTLLCPLGFAMGGSRSTKDICFGYIRTYASMIVMMVLNVLFLKLILSALASMPPDALVLPWCLLVVGIAKTARKADNLVSRIGLNPAITGDPLGNGHGAMSAILAAKTIMRSVSKNHAAKSAGKANTGTSRTYASSRNMSGGTQIGGASVHNAGGKASSNARSNTSATGNTSTNAQARQNMQNSQSSRFGAANTTANTRADSSSRFGSTNHNTADSHGSVAGGDIHFGRNGNTRVNTNRFGSSSAGLSGMRSANSKPGTAHSTAAGGAHSKGNAASKTNQAAAKVSPGPSAAASKQERKATIRQPGSVAQKSAAKPAARFGSTGGKALSPAAGGLRQNANPFKSTMLKSGQIRINTNAALPAQTDAANLSETIDVQNNQAGMDVPSLESGEKNE